MYLSVQGIKPRYSVFLDESVTPYTTVADVVSSRYLFLFWKQFVEIIMKKKKKKHFQPVLNKRNLQEVNQALFDL